MFGTLTADPVALHIRIDSESVLQILRISLLLFRLLPILCIQLPLIPWQCADS